MKRFSSVVILLIFVIAMAFLLAACGTTTYKTKDLDFNATRYSWNNYISVDCDFVVCDLSKGQYDLDYVLVFKDGDGNILCEKQMSSNVTVAEGQTETKVSKYFNVEFSEVSDATLIKQIVVEDLHIAAKMSTEENRLKPYSIAICVSACAGATAMVVVFICLSCVKRNKQSVTKPDTENQRSDTNNGVNK